ncbi:MAG: hypothetical protein ACI9VS_003614 [Candidatus Binatia bacterium]|jgi:hypothetical protein
MKWTLTQETNRSNRIEVVAQQAREKTNLELTAPTSESIQKLNVQNPTKFQLPIDSEPRSWIPVAP